MPERFFTRLFEVLREKVKKPSFHLRFNTEGIMYATTSEYEALSFDVINVSETGFALRVKPEPSRDEYAKFLNSIFRDKKVDFKIKLYLVTGKSFQEKGMPFYSVEVRARLKAAGQDDCFGFEVDKKYRARLREIIRILKNRTILETTLEGEGKRVTQDGEKPSLRSGYAGDGNVFNTSLFTVYLLSLLEEKKENVLQSRVKFRLYVLLFILFLVTGFVPGTLSQYFREVSLRRAVERYENTHNAKVLYLVHRKKQLGFFGIPVYEYLEVHDAHRLLAELKKTPQDKNVVLVIHSPGGELLAGMQIARMLKDWKGKVTVVVPYYAMSAGTLIALSADEIYANKGTTFGPVDPQIVIDSEKKKAVSAVDVLRVCYGKNNVNGKLNLEESALCEVSKKAVNQVKEFLESVVLTGKPESVKRKIVKNLLYTEKTHDYPFFADDLKKLGLNIKENVPEDLAEVVDYLITM